jgi:hypothetical protein
MEKEDGAKKKKTERDPSKRVRYLRDKQKIAVTWFVKALRTFFKLFFISFIIPLTRRVNKNENHRSCRLLVLVSGQLWLLQEQS